MRRSRSRNRLYVNQLEWRDAPTASKIGSEFRVNVLTANAQNDAHVAMDFRGDFVVAWTSPADGISSDIFARRFGSNGAPLTGELLVNSFTSGVQNNPAVAMNAGGDFVVVWQSGNSVISQDGSFGGVYGQRYDAAGNRRGTEFQVNTYTTGQQSNPTVSMDIHGNFVVAWVSDGQDGSNSGIYAQAFDSNGLARGSEFRINVVTINDQFGPDIAMDWAGNFVVAWDSILQDGDSDGIFARRYDANGIPLSGEFLVNTTTTNSQFNATAAMDATGDFEIAWHSLHFDPSGHGIYVQRYLPNGVAVGTESFVSRVFVPDIGAPSAALSVNNEDVIAFMKRDGDLSGIAAKTSSSGLDDFAVSTTTTLMQEYPDVAMDANGDFVVVWDGNGSGDNYGIFAQRYHESGDSVGPLVTGVYSPLSPQPVIEGQRLMTSINSIVVSFSEDMNQAGGSTGAQSIINPANWKLTRDGVDISNQIAGVTFAFNNFLQRHEATVNFSSLLQDHRFYTLTASSNLRDAAGNQLDGNYDTIRGDAFSRSFVIGSTGPVGPESKVNTTGGPSLHITTAQSAVASNPAGQTIVAWRGSFANADLGVFAQIYDAHGGPITSEISVSTTGLGQIGVAIDPGGDFVVAYSRDADGSGDGVYARRFNILGVPIGLEFRINTTTTGNQHSVVVAMDNSGDMVFAWETPGLNGNSRVFGRRFSAEGIPLGGEFQVDDGPSFNESAPAIAMDPAGNFVLAWQGFVTGPGFDIYARRYSALGERQGSEFPVNSFTTGNQLGPTAAMDAAGNFVIAWSSPNQASVGSSFDIIARRYDALGVAQGGEFVVNSSITNVQQFPAVAARGQGDFTIAWESSGQEGVNFGIFAQRYAATGTKIGSEIHVNTLTADDQRFPALAMDSEGDVTVVWQSFEGTNSNIKVQRYGIAPPQVVSLVVNDLQTQRSRLTSLRVTFDGPVIFLGIPQSDFVLTRQSDNSVATFSMTVTSLTLTNATVVTFDNFAGPAAESGSLRDGRYTLRIAAGGVLGVGGPLDGNSDLAGGDDYVLIGDPAVAPKLFRLFGDADGNGIVTAADFNAFRLAYGSAGPSIFDFNGDTQVSASDFAAFRSRFGQII